MNIRRYCAENTFKSFPTFFLLDSHFFFERGQFSDEKCAVAGTRSDYQHVHVYGDLCH